MHVRWLWWLLGMVAAVGLTVATLMWTTGRGLKAQRVQWKDKALQQLASVAPAEAIAAKRLRDTQYDSNYIRAPFWRLDEVLTMTNGEFLIYRHRHGFNNGRVDHLFLARGSNEKWYFSTYHFCNQMAGLTNDEQPGSIAEFSKQYFLREFDGKSDVCLERTWPVETEKR